jgi:hypothetical protein
MLPDASIRQIALDVGRTTLAPQRVVDVVIEPTVTWDGEDALWVMTVVPATDMPKLTGNKLIDYMKLLDERLQQEGEQRRTIPRWATPEDLAGDLTADADAEP